MKTVRPANPAAAIGTGRGRAFRQTVIAEGKQFFVLFVYLWILLGLFVLNERIILHQHAIDFAAHGFALLNAFVLAKVMLIIEHLNLSRWLNRRPLIYPILHDAFAFSLLFIVFHIVEEKFVSLVKGAAYADAIPNIGGGGISGILCVAVILFFALLPFFGFKYVRRALGPDKMRSMLFAPPAG